MHGPCATLLGTEAPELNIAVREKSNPQTNHESDQAEPLKCANVDITNHEAKHDLELLELFEF